MAFEHLQDLLPEGAVLTAVKTPEGQAAINVKTAHWQAAIPLTGDADRDEWAILGGAWSQQHLYEIRQRKDAINVRYEDEIRQMRAQVEAETDTKIKQIKAQHEARKAPKGE